MKVENGQPIGRPAEAMAIVNESNGSITIAPCLQINPNGQETTCENSNRDFLCTFKDGEFGVKGIITDRHGGSCPRQRGQLVFQVKELDKVLV